MAADCYSCRSIAGEKRISPGPYIHEGRFWLVDHAYPTKMKGWLVLVLRRHAEALHELTSEEHAEMAQLLERTVRLLHREMGCEKEYAMCFAEAEHFNHIHLHVVPKPANLPEDLRGPRIFAMLKVSQDEAVPPEEIKEFCERFAAQWDGQL
jgi:diadenosine tetraphosphate (Ap4A) HIT family hydrolase